MRIGVYNSHLATLGGGEQYSMAIVRWLLERGHDVDVLARPGTSIAECEARLGLSLPGARLVTVDADPIGAEREASARSAEYDVFVNATYASGMTSRAPRSALVVYFPIAVAALPDLDDTERQAWVDTARRSPLGWIENDHGLHAAEAGGAWSDGRASYVLRLSQPGSAAVRVTLGSGRPTSLPPATATFLLDDRPLREVTLPRAGAVTVDVELPAALTTGHRHRFDVVTDRFNPAALGISDDERDLGAFVQQVGLTCASAGDDQVEYGWRLRFLDSYDRVVAISDYTAEWVRRVWGETSSVVHPPVTPVDMSAAPPAPKRDLVVALGRFFEGSHSKKQRELVGAFKRLCDEGLDGWTLALAGGVVDEQRRYFDEVADEVAGYPIELHPNAPRADVERLLREARLFWQATGWGEDPRRHPERFEHFGIALVEAMSAGAVPVALGIGGIGEIVRHEREGLLWSPAEGPGPATRHFAARPDAVVAMARRARLRARRFTAAAFERELERTLGPLLRGRRRPWRR